MSPVDPMPRHDILRRLIQCTCGETMPASEFERHWREREPQEVGRWIADRALADLRAALAASPSRAGDSTPDGADEWAPEGAFPSSEFYEPGGRDA